MKKIVFHFVAWGCLLSVWAEPTTPNTLWVDRAHGRETAAGTEQDPYQTIQQAVQAASMGTTIKVRPGHYDTGGVYVESNGTMNRVWVAKKNLTIESTDGPEVTAILGKHDTTAASRYGMGDQAERCVLVEPDMELVLKGFTLANGASRCARDAADVRANRGGAVSSNGDVMDTEAFTLVDCIITNNVGTRGGAVYGGRAVRCRFFDNHASNFGHAVRETVLYYCLFAKNDPLPGANDGIGVVAWGQGVYNCTFADNAAAVLSNTTAPIVNSLFVGNQNVYGGSSATCIPWFTNCVVENTAVVQGATRCVYGTLTELHSPATLDFRLDAKAASLTAGDAAVAAAYPVGWREKDVYGNPVSFDDGAFFCGAVQMKTVTRARLAFATVSSENGVMYVSGVKLGRRSGVFAGTDKAAAAVCIRYVPADGTKGVYSYARADELCVPAWDDTAWVAFADGDDRTVTARVTEKFWVDQATGDDETADGSSGKPYATIQRALNDTKATSPRVVCVKPGTYGENGASEWARDCRSRVVLADNWQGHVRLTSSDGRDKTVIVGAKDTSAANGFGANAVRCLTLTGEQIVSGFTLRGGYANMTANGADGDACRGGGAFADPAAYITDCRFEGCSASRGAVGWSGNYERCIFTGNLIGNNGILRAATVVACLAYGNRIKNATTFGWGMNMYQCTVADEIGESGAAAITVDTGAAAVGLVLGAVQNGTSLASPGQSSAFVDTLYLNATGASAIESPTVVQGNAYFSTDGLYRVCGASRAVGLLSGERIVSWSDVYGRPYVLDADGKTVAGAVADTAPGVVAHSDYAGGISPDGWASPADGSGKVTFTATLADRRPCLGFLVNGVFCATDGQTFTLTVDPAAAYRVAPLYATNFYVNVQTGNDTYPGSPEKPLATLAEASSRVRAGDVVTVAPGVYATRSSTPTKAELGATVVPVIPARVFVPSGVVFESEGGWTTAAETVIEGVQDWTTDSGIGLGSKAMHGAYLAPGSVLRGFTLRGCGTGYENTESLNDCGGGIWAADRTARIESCILTNNAAYRGGAARNGTYVGCRFLCNATIRLAPSTRDAYHYGCFFDGNQGDTITYGFHYENCTFGAGNLIPDGQAVAIHCLSQDGGVVNTLVAKGRVNASFVSNVVVAAENQIVQSSLTSAHCVVVGGVALDGEGRPVVGQNAAIDAGDASLSSPDVRAAGDLDGGQRIYNNTLDCGAYEYDWRATYARLLSPTAGFRVVSAPPTCVAEAGGVRLLDGTLAATWLNASAARTRLAFSACVTGAGVLTVLCDGTQLARLTAADGAVTREYLVPANDLAFVYARAETDGATPGALLTAVARSSGMTLLIR